MTDKRVENEVQEFCDAWQGLNGVYEDYARKNEIPYTNLFILNILSKTENCTQKMICERTLLPRQTVNTIITYFYKAGMVELRELPEDRRVKSVHLTKKGQAYTDKVMPQIHEAELAAMEALTEEQRQALLIGMRIYCETFRRELDK